jgi:hypothetical protein
MNLKFFKIYYDVWGGSTVREEVQSSEFLLDLIKGSVWKKNL